MSACRGCDARLCQKRQPSQRQRTYSMLRFTACLASLPTARCKQASHATRQAHLLHDRQQVLHVRPAAQHPEHLPILGLAGRVQAHPVQASRRQLAAGSWRSAVGGWCLCILHLHACYGPWRDDAPRDGAVLDACTLMRTPVCTAVVRPLWRRVASWPEGVSHTCLCPRKKRCAGMTGAQVQHTPCTHTTAWPSGLCCRHEAQTRKECSAHSLSVRRALWEKPTPEV